MLDALQDSVADNESLVQNGGIFRAEKALAPYMYAEDGAKTRFFEVTDRL